MSAKMVARSMPYYQGKQSDDDFQRHNANRHRREESGQDRWEQSDDDNSSGTTPIAIIAKEADKTNLGNRLSETTLAWCCTLCEVRKRSMTSALISCGALGPTSPEMDSG
ncbi:hypothetical protein HO173_010546 [Letharia columbiana]|uniref:Uncharacterized protein n=1 Tax=Letharia columbiana TaxID=112416 RepID=A0A8H6FMF6_9LECA|nr:uncharacterized protein HO173_010546 [Letharia columbiana]KAF6231214.1 hypothetical protein HO173_010546 [Letharia columbiana]